MKAQINTAGLSTERILTSTTREAIRLLNGKKDINHLDLGSGNGELIRLIKANTQTISSACDYTEDLPHIEYRPLKIVLRSSKK